MKEALIIRKCRQNEETSFLFSPGIALLFQALFFFFLNQFFVSRKHLIQATYFAAAPAFDHVCLPSTSLFHALSWIYRKLSINIYQVLQL